MEYWVQGEEDQKTSWQHANMCVAALLYRANSLTHELANIDTDERVVELDVENLSIKCNEIIEKDKR